MKLKKIFALSVLLSSSLLSIGCKKDSSTNTDCKAVLFDNGNTAACTTPTDTSVFTLPVASTVTAVNVWVNTLVSGPTLSYALFGPGENMISSGAMTKGSCDPIQTNWCQFTASMNTTLGAGRYTVKTSAVATCSNSGSNNIGFVSVNGCNTAVGKPDGGCPYGGASYGGGCANPPVSTTCNSKLFDNGNTAACTTPTDSSVFSLTSAATVTAINLWVNTTISGQSLSYTLSGATGTLSSGAMTKGSCDPYQTNWCQFTASLNLTLAAGSYTVKSSAKATCSNAGSNGNGFVQVMGCSGSVTKTPDAGCALGGGAYGGCRDASAATACNATLFDNGNVAACTTLMDSSTFTLSTTSTVNYIRLWENTTVSGQSVTYQLANSAGTVLSSGPTTKGGCDPYQTNWCEFLVNTSMVLPAGSYTVKSSAKAICANSGSGNLGQVMVKGCAGGTVVADAGCPYGGAKYGGCVDAPIAPTCNGKLFDNGNTAACTTPTDTSVFSLSAASTVSAINLWVNTTISGQSLSYALTGPAGTVSSGAMTKGACDPYQTNWCQFTATPNLTLAAGSYTVKASAKATCSNSGSSGVGFVSVLGCAGTATTPDAGVPDAAACTGIIMENWNTAACTTPTDTSSFALTTTSTVTGLQIWVNTTLSGAALSYTLTNAAGTLIGSGPMTKGSCDPYQTNWCAFEVSMNLSLPAGSYTVKSSAKATCSNTGSSGNGFLRVMGCGSATKPDAGLPADTAGAPLALCSGATAYFPFAEGTGTSTLDLAAAHVGTLTGNVAWVTEKLGYGVAVNGTNYVSVPDAVDLDPGVSDFSLSAWVRIPATTCTHSRLITHGTHGQPGNDGYALMEWGGSWGAVPCGGVALLVGSSVKAAEWLVGTCTPMNDGLLHHYVGVVNRAGTMDLYVDGVKVAAPCTGLSGSAAWGPTGARDITPLAGLALAPTCALCIGASCQNQGACGTPSEFFSGSIDEVGFWKRALTATDVSTAYALGAGKAICP